MESYDGIAGLDVARRAHNARDRKWTDIAVVPSPLRPVAPSRGYVVPVQMRSAEYDGVAGLGDLGASVFKNVTRAVSKAAKDTGHATGAALDNKYVKGALATGLALTGVGAPLAVGIMAGEGVAAGALKKGGGLKEAVRRGYQGAVIGAVAGEAGTIKNIAVSGAKKAVSLAKAGVHRVERVFNKGKSPAEGGPDANGSVLDTLAAGAIPDVGTIQDRARRRRHGVIPVDDANNMATNNQSPTVQTAAAGQPDSVDYASVAGGAMDAFKNPVVLVALGFALFAFSRGGGSGVATQRRGR